MTADFLTVKRGLLFHEIVPNDKFVCKILEKSPLQHTDRRTNIYEVTCLSPPRIRVLTTENDGIACQTLRIFKKVKSAYVIAAENAHLTHPMGLL